MNMKVNQKQSEKSMKHTWFLENINTVDRLSKKEGKDKCSIGNKRDGCRSYVH